MPDPERAPAVKLIFALRVTERLGYREIADRLNAALDRYSPPRCNAQWRQRDRWGASNVRGVLTNPKYTGYMVWNRQARKTKNGRLNPPYPLRSYVICHHCGRRMFGKQKRQFRYFACQPALNHRALVAERFADHPASVWVREDHSGCRARCRPARL